MAVGLHAGIGLRKKAARKEDWRKRNRNVHGPFPIGETFLHRLGAATKIAAERTEPNQAGDYATKVTNVENELLHGH